MTDEHDLIRLTVSIECTDDEADSIERFLQPFIRPFAPLRRETTFGQPPKEHTVVVIPGHTDGDARAAMLALGRVSEVAPSKPRIERVPIFDALGRISARYAHRLTIIELIHERPWIRAAHSSGEDADSDGMVEVLIEDEPRRETTTPDPSYDEIRNPR